MTKEAMAVRSIVASLSPSRIALDLSVSSKKRLFEHIGLLLENDRKISRSEVFDALIARERLGSTALGLGVAIPHGRMRSLKDVATVFVRLEDGIPFDAPDGVPTRLVFAMLVPEHANEQHLALLSELAQLFSDDAMRDALLAATNSSAILNLLSTWSQNAELKRPAAV